MTLPSSTTLAALLCSRLCHDLLSPVGAIGNGLELLADEDDPEMRRSSLDLLEQSARTSLTKLQYFRFAYGSPGGMSEGVPTSEPRRLLEALVADGGRVELDWAVAAEQMPMTATKILLNFAAMGIAALVRGGSLAAGAESGEHGVEIAVRAAGPRVAFDPLLGRTLTGDVQASELSAQNAHAQLVRSLALDEGGEIQHAVSDDTLLLGAFLPIMERDT